MRRKGPSASAAVSSDFPYLKISETAELGDGICGIEKRVREEITYGDIHESEENLWNFLFFMGYLKKVGESTVYSLTARVETTDLILSCKRQIFEKAA